MSNIKLSIVSPVYRAEKMVHMLVECIVKSVTTITEDFEIILICFAEAETDVEAKLLFLKSAFGGKL